MKDPPFSNREKEETCQGIGGQITHRRFPPRSGEYGGIRLHDLRGRNWPAHRSASLKGGVLGKAIGPYDQKVFSSPENSGLS
jgi:hypothetical protein